MKVYYSIAIGMAAGAVVLFLWSIFRRKVLRKHFPFLEKRIGVSVEVAELSNAYDMRGYLLVKNVDGKLVRPSSCIDDLDPCFKDFYKHLDGSVDRHRRSFEVIVDPSIVFTDRDYLITDLSEFKIWKKYHTTAHCIVAAAAILMSACCLAFFIFA